MIRIMSKDGATFEGRTNEQVARAIYRASRVWHESDKQFARAVARRVMLWNGKRIRVGTAQKFLTDLAAARLIRFLTK